MTGLQIKFSIENQIRARLNAGHIPARIYLTRETHDTLLKYLAESFDGEQRTPELLEQFCGLKVEAFPPTGILVV